MGTTVICIALIAFCVYREWAWARERADLLQRIQAPQAAVVEHVARDRGSPARTISAADDKGFREAKGLED